MPISTFKPIQFQQPDVNVTIPNYNYTPTYGSNTPIGQLINNIGQNFKPAVPFSQQLSKEDYLKPIYESFNNAVETQFKPEYQRFQLNPFQSSLGDAAVRNSQNLGWSKNYDDALTQFQNENYYNPIQNAWNGVQNQYSDLYDTQLKKSETSPVNMLTLAQQSSATPPPSEPVQQTPAPTPQPAAYKVQSGDTIWGIWNKMYKNKYNWTDFQNRMKSMYGGALPRLFAGNTLNLPN